MPPKKALPVPKPKPAAAAPAVVAPAEPESRRARGYTQQIEAKFADTGVGKTLRLNEKKPAAATLRQTLGRSASKAVAVAKAKEEAEDEPEKTLTDEALEEVERELVGSEAIDESSLSDRDWSEAEKLAESGVDARVVSLFKMGAALEGQMAASLEVDDVGSAEDLGDQAIAKFNALLLLDTTNRVGLRRLACALVRKAEFREGEAADFAYERAVATFDTILSAWPEDAAEVYEHKALALIDRAKNRAAMEDAAKGNFTQTRKLLSEAKLAAQQAMEPEPLERAISEVLTWCRLQTDQRKKTEAKPAASAPAAATATSKPLPKALPVLDKDKSAQRMSMHAAVNQRAPSLAPPADKKARPMSTSGVSPRKKQEEEAAAAAAAAAKRAEEEAARNKPKAASVKAANPKAIVREGSKKGKEMDGARLGEKEKIQAQVDAKKPVSKVGKLMKEGGGKSLLGRKTWKERLFELSESALEYYEKSNQDESPLGAISLYEVVTTKPCAVPGKDHCFELVTKTRVFQIQASSAAERDDWIKAIRNNCERQALMKSLLGLK